VAKKPSFIALAQIFVASFDMSTPKTSPKILERLQKISPRDATKTASSHSATSYFYYSLKQYFILKLHPKLA
jgi:hypothetical protein